MADEKTKELKRYTRELLRDHQALEQSLAEAEAVAEARAEEVKRLQEEAKKQLEEQQQKSAVPSSSGSVLFGELTRQRDRAYAAEVEAQRLKVMLEMARELRSVDIARTKAASSRALFAAMANLRKRQDRASLRTPGEEGDAEFLELFHDELDAEEQKKRKLLEDEALARRERGLLVDAVEAACQEVVELFRRKPRPLHNTDGSARRLVTALEEAASHRVDHKRRTKVDPYASFVLQAASAAARLRLKKKAEDAVLVCIAKAKEARIPAWMKRIGWGVGRAALLELLNRGVANVAFRAMTLEINDDSESTTTESDVDHIERLMLVYGGGQKKKNAVTVAGPAVATYRPGAVFLNPTCSRRIVRALYDVEVQSKVLFSFSHLNDKSKRFLDDDKRSLGFQANFRTFFDGAVNLVACGGGTDDSLHRVPSDDDNFETKEALDDDDDDDDAYDALDRVSNKPQQQQGVDIFDVAPGPTMLAALRRRGVKSAATAALDLTPWRKANIEPPRLWSKKRGSLERRIKLREGPVPHVVCYQWQSLSQKLKWSLVFDRGSAPGLNNEASPSRRRRNSPTMPTTPEHDEPQADLQDNSDESVAGGDHGMDIARRWGGELAIPDDDSDEASVAVTSVASSRMSMAFKAPETWSPAELVPGADKTLGPVREAWCVVPPGARVSLRCDLVAGRPLVRARHARYRLNAIRADDFFDNLRDVADLADLVGWHVAKDHTTFPPADAADFCAKKQLLPISASGPRDLIDAHLRIDAHLHNKSNVFLF